MTNDKENKRLNRSAWKKRAISELTRYWLYVLYLVLFFGAFTWYRRLILAQYDISYLNYGISIIEALVLAKVILLGDLLRLGRRFQDRPLIVTTLYKTAVFGVFVLAFAVLEDICKALLHGKSVAEEMQVLMYKDRYELLARCLVVLVAFLPFFAFQEIGRLIGEKKIYLLFFKVDHADQSRNLPRHPNE